MNESLRAFHLTLYLWAKIYPTLQISNITVLL